MNREQHSLFGSPARARHSDPQPSHRAARKVTRSGKATRQRQQILQALREHPGATSAELAQLMGIDRHDAGRRLPELRSAGLVSNGRERLCQVTNFVSLTWLPINDAATQSSKPALRYPSRKRHPPAKRSACPPSPTEPKSAAIDDPLIAWFRSASAAGELPAEPFDLRPGTRIIGPAGFYASLRTDIAAGPIVTYRGRTVARARWSPLLTDLSDLKRITEELAG